MLKYITSICTLEPGDLVFSGALNHLPPLRAGDKLECEIEGLGKFTTNCRLEHPASESAA
jgi:2-keto-4-pentenoate hydratase/2-oxohepta-3-ene-1,7-dioic acid hydratase in catechol pathway